MTPRGPGTVVVQTPLRKLWVQVQRVATSMRQVRRSSSAIRELLSPLSSRIAPLYPPTTRPRLATHRRCSPVPAGRVLASAWNLAGDPEPSPGPPGRGSPGPPRRGVRNPPKRGGAGILNNVNFGGFHRS